MLWHANRRIAVTLPVKGILAPNSLIWMQGQMSLYCSRAFKTTFARHPIGADQLKGTELSPTRMERRRIRTPGICFISHRTILRKSTMMLNSYCSVRNMNIPSFLITLTASSAPEIYSGSRLQDNQAKKSSDL